MASRPTLLYCFSTRSGPTVRFECEVRVPILREKSCERRRGTDRGGRGAVIFLRLWGEGVRPYAGTPEGDSPPEASAALGRRAPKPLLMAAWRLTSRCSSDIGCRQGLVPIRHGHDGHAIAKQLRTSCVEPAQQSRHLARIASVAVIASCPIASSSALAISRGSRPTNHSLPSPGSQPARFAAPRSSTDSPVTCMPVQISRARSRPRRVVTSNTVSFDTEIMQVQSPDQFWRDPDLAERARLSRACDRPRAPSLSARLLIRQNLKRFPKICKSPPQNASYRHPTPGQNLHRRP